METFMGAVVLRAARATTFQINAQGQPPRREPGEAENSVPAGERRAVIAANSSRQAVSLEQFFKTGAHRFGAGIGHRAHFKNVAAKFIAHGERFAAAALSFIPPAFEINGPDIVRFFSDALGV